MSKLLPATRTCPECGRVFDMFDAIHQEEWVYGHDCEDEGYEDDLSDVDADAMTLGSAGWGTDEDYGYYGGPE
jgi:hypothetical protein